VDASTIYCPACNNGLRLPPQIEVLKTVHQGGGSYVAFGDPGQVLPCPHCGTRLAIRDILSGKYDSAKFTTGSFVSIVVIVAIIAVVVILWRSC
jgi:hypothetical protein